MRTIKLMIFSIFYLTYNTFGAEVIFKIDNGNPKGMNYQASRNGWEESVVLQPLGPCKINKLHIYYSGTQKAKDTIHFVGFPTAGNLYPTEYIWSYNSLIEPVIFDYDGTPGWKEIDISNTGLRSDGFDKIVIQHIMNPKGPFFTFDNDGMSGLSWITDPFTPNGNFYDIMGTIHYNSQGDFMVRFVLEYLFPKDSISMNPPAPTLYNTNLISGGGYPSIVDWNNDGYDDIVLGGTIFQNNQNSTFTNISAANPINASGTAWGDFDNDGKIDCYAIANGAADFDKRLEWNNNAMYKNTGTQIIPINQKSVFKTPYPSTKFNFLTSTDNNKDSIHNPYNSISPVFFDYNNDGFLDLFIANRRTELSGKPEMFSPDELWEGSADGTFKNVSVPSGIHAGETYTPYDGSNGFGYYDCYGAMAVDYNKDNKTDIFVANYRLIKDNLFKNNGNSTFTENAAQTGVQGLPTAAQGYFGHGMGCQWGDFNNDGNPDLIVGNLAHTDYRGIYSNPSLIFKNLGSPSYKFDEVHTKMGLKFHEGNAGSIWADLDLDGNLDLWHGKYSGGMGFFYFNQGAPDYKLVEKTWELNCVVQNPWVAVKTDYDNDGDFDFVINGQLYRNDIIHKGKFIGIRLVGSPKDKVNMDAYGTKVTITAGGKVFYQELSGSSAGTLCSQNSNELLFGLGEVNKIDGMTIEYSNGTKTVITKQLDLNAKYTVTYPGTVEQKLVATPAQVYPENNQIILDTNFIQFKWNSVAGAKEYYVTFLNSPNGFELGTNITKDTLSHFFKPNPYKTYYWKVRAVNPDGTKTPFSSEWAFSIGMPSASSITKVYPKKDSINIPIKSKFIWNKAEFPIFLRDQIINYEISIFNEFNELLLIQSGITDTSRIFPALSPNKKYKWKICAGIAGGYLICSPIWEFTTLGLPEAIQLTEPANNAIDVTTKPYFKWTESTIANFYQLQASQDSLFTTIDLLKDSIQYASYKLFKGMNGQTLYYWRVRAMNDGGYGKWSDTWKFKTGGVNNIFEEENPNNLFKIDEISPNPAKEKINLKISSAINDKITIFVVNNIGLTIKTFENVMNIGTNNLELRLDGISSGIYFIKITNNQFSITKPFLLIH